MRLGLILGYSGGEAGWDFSLVREAERLGYQTVWSAEAYGSDAVTPLAWAGALTSRIRLGTGIMQMPARSPAMTAMTAMTLDQLSGGRFVLGLGMSGPQVVEGWHGVPYGKILGRTREYVSILRDIFAREAPLEHQGQYYTIPYAGPDATGLGKPLKSILHGRAGIPIYIAAIGPKNTALAAEIADGWIPTQFSAVNWKVFAPHLEEGFAKAGGGKGGGMGGGMGDGMGDGISGGAFDICPSVTVVPGDDVAACRDKVKPRLALYIGGMGARGRNFYNDLARRYGYEEAAEKIQEAYLDGRKAEAAAAVPDALVDEVALCGPPERIKDQLAPWLEAPITTLNLRDATPAVLRLMAELVL
ncbi:MAG: LLM class F420-dependent oxidoreductase [SAR324 cluster bacterium]|nr:LLM class F420-dependent oxidoreductase [SAR324 cluster bacterium]